MAPLYLALREDLIPLSTRTVNLTDPAKYQILKPGWQPGVASLNAQGQYNTVTESLEVQVCGETPTEVYTNLAALTSILTQAMRWGNYEQVSPIMMDYAPFGGVKRLGSRVISWDPTGYLPMDYNHSIITTNKVLVTITLVREGPLYHTAWVYENLLENSGWNDPPVPAFVGVNGTITYTASSTPANVHATVRLTKSFSTPAALHAPTVIIECTAGSPVTVRFTAVGAAGFTSLAVQLVTGGIIPASNVVAFPTGGECTATFTPTDTGFLRIYWTAYGAAASTLTISKVLAVDGIVPAADMTWHRRMVEHVGSSPSVSSIQPLIQGALFPVPAGDMSPVTIRIGGGLSRARNPTVGAGYVLVSPRGSGQGIFLHGMPAAGAKTVAPFATVVDTANNAYTGNVTRYTPAGTTKLSTHTTPTTLNGGGSNIPGELVAFAVVRNNSATTAFSLSLKLTDLGGNTAETLQVVLPGNAVPVPRIIPLGSLFGEDGYRSWELMIQASAGVGTCDIGYVAFLLVEPGAQAVALDAIQPLAAGATQYITLDPAVLTHRQARYGIAAASASAANQARAGYRGGMRHLCSMPTSPQWVYVLWLATYSTSWVHVDAGISMSTVTSAALVCTRLPAQIVAD